MSCYLFRLFLKRLNFGKYSSGFAHELSLCGALDFFSELKDKGLNWNQEREKVILEYEDKPVKFVMDESPSVYYEVKKTFIKKRKRK